MLLIFFNVCYFILKALWLSKINRYETNALKAKASSVLAVLLAAGIMHNFSCREQAVQFGFLPFLYSLLSIANLTIIRQY